MRRIKWTFLCCAGVFVLSACHESKYLGSGQLLYVGNRVEWQSSEKLSHAQTRQVKSDLKALLRPRLNGKILGMRIRLAIYNSAGHPTNPKGLRYWIKNTVGEAPVLASTSITETNRAILQDHLENKGWFGDTVTVETPVKDKKLTAVFTAHVGPQYTIRQITYPTDSDALGKRIDSLGKHSLLKKGDPFDLDNIKAERDRIDTRLKQRGYYYFNPNDLVVDVDSSSAGNHQVDMQLKIKPETPEQARRSYRINQVVVFSNYDINSDTSLRHAYRTAEGYRIIDTAGLFKPVIFSRTLVFKPGDLYKRDDHSLSLSRLVSLGVFKFVKARFEPVDTAMDRLNVFYYLTPSQKKSIRFEVSALTRSDNTTGGEVAINWRNRNLFRGAELLTATLYGGVQEQYVAIGQQVTTTREGLDVDLYIPRIVAPFRFTTSSAYMPKTRISASYDFFDESAEYTLNSAKTSYGYIFKDNQTTENQLTVFGINYVNPTRINPTYAMALDTNITLKRAIERQFILGPIYNFNYNSQAKPNHRQNNFYFNGNVDLSGNFPAWLISGGGTGKQDTLFHTPVSEYARFEVDFRHYLSLGKYRMLASRITGGVGWSYGSSITMPFIKEFFAGGTNDVRAFRSRALGPGTYYAGNPNTTPLLPDQPGDVKMELNVEYRDKLFSIVRWALFADAGNVWTLHPDPDRPGSVLTHSFLNDFAVGVGTGLRFDLSILVLRVDVAVPVRYPWLPDGSKWKFNSATDISNLVLNLAIGYPF